MGRVVGGSPGSGRRNPCARWWRRSEDPHPAAAPAVSSRQRTTVHGHPHPPDAVIGRSPESGPVALAHVLGVLPRRHMDATVALRMAVRRRRAGAQRGRATRPDDGRAAGSGQRRRERDDADVTRGQDVVGRLEQSRRGGKRAETAVEPARRTPYQRPRRRLLPQPTTDAAEPSPDSNASAVSAGKRPLRNPLYGI